MEKSALCSKVYDLCGKSFFLYCVLSNFRGRLPFPYFQNGSGNSGSGKKELGILISVCVGRELYGYAEFLEGTNEVREKSCLHFLYGEEAVILLENDSEKKETVLLLSEQYKRLAEMLYIADEKI